MIRFLILAGYFEVSMYLYLTGKLNQYINSHYTYLAFLTMALSFLLALIQLFIWVKNLKPSHHALGKLAAVTSPIILVFPILVALFVPTVTLDATTVSAKGYHFPLASGSNPAIAQEDGTSIQYLRPDTSLYFTSSSYQKEMQKALSKYKKLDKIGITTDNYMEVMELIYLYPEAFLGRTISYTGFVYNEPKHDGYQFLFRFGVIHCIADSGVYGLLTSGATENYPDNEWLAISGVLSIEYNQALEQILPILHIKESKRVNKPQNPYVYRTF